MKDKISAEDFIKAFGGNMDKKIINMKITNVSLNMKNHGILSFDLTLEGEGYGVIYGGYCLGNGYLGSDSFKGSAAGIECLMRIMDVIGVDSWEDLNGKYCRIFTECGKTVKIIGNIIENKWFDIEAFFNEAKVNIGGKNEDSDK